MTLMFKLEFETDNEAFSYSYGASETARILRKLAQRIEAGDLDGNVLDINGNSVGTYELNGD